MTAMTLVAGRPRDLTRALKAAKMTPWKAPRLTTGGKPFDPSDLAPGAWLQVSRLHGDSITVQVWSLAPGPRTAWCVTEDRVTILVRAGHHGYEELSS
jgi:hypothetical protein